MPSVVGDARQKESFGWRGWTGRCAIARPNHLGQPGDGTTAAPDLDQCPHNGPHHVPEETVACDLVCDERAWTDLKIFTAAAQAWTLPFDVQPCAAACQPRREHFALGRTRVGA